MPITSVNKTASAAAIEPGGSLRVTLTVDAKPGIVEHPVDVALLLDRSGSMAGEAMTHLKEGAKEFVRILAQTTGGTDSLRGGSRIGIISFAVSATIDQPLTDDTAALDAAIEALSARGNTNQAAAFGQAQAMLASSTARKVVVMFTDGEPTVGPDPSPVAAELRSQGIEIWCIGLVGTDGVNVDSLNDWATPPPAEHVRVSPDAAELEQLFHDLAADIAEPGAQDIIVNEVVSDQFVITDVDAPSLGSAEFLGTRIIRWRIEKLAAEAPERATLTFTVQNMGSRRGMVPINQSVSLTDRAGEQVEFPMPEVNVEGGGSGGGTYCPEDCPDPVDVTVDACQDSAAVDAGEIHVAATGRMLAVSFKLARVCPLRDVAVGVVVSELLADGTEASRGFKAFTVPAQGGQTCGDINVRCVRFVLPDDAAGVGLCTPRRFRVRVLANPTHCSWSTVCTCEETPQS